MRLVVMMMIMGSRLEKGSLCYSASAREISEHTVHMDKHRNQQDIMELEYCRKKSSKHVAQLICLCRLFSKLDLV
jgi:hypothetical protein